MIASNPAAAARKSVAHAAGDREYARLELRLPGQRVKTHEGEWKDLMDMCLAGCAALHKLYPPAGLSSEQLYEEAARMGD